MCNARYIRNRGLDAATREILFAFLLKKLDITSNDVDIIISYLKRREKEVKRKDFFGIVYDITQLCNLNCMHCCVNAKFSNNKEKSSFETTYEEVCTIIDRVYEYLKGEKIEKYLYMFGGGEPFLRPDFCDILEYTSRKVGAANVGINTNGTLVNLESLLELRKTINILEISIDGFEVHHNKWRDPEGITGVSNPFKKSFSLVSEISTETKLSEILEISSIATTDNMKELPDFIRFVYDETGVKNYSIHRAIPIGKMSIIANKVPSSQDYVHLLIELAKLKETAGIKLHFHHSLESIYSVLFLGRDIHKSDISMRSGRHSIGIRWDGEVFFDPWCMVPPYDLLSSGNLLNKDQELEIIMESELSPIRIVNSILSENVRCKQCKLPCSGGMRVNALTEYINNTPETLGISLDRLIRGLSQIDPACPLNE